MADGWTEPGRSVADNGAIVYAWPPTGRFHHLWACFDADFTDEEKHELLALLLRWRDDASALVAFTDEAGEWVDVEPNWAEPQRWMEWGQES
jgi:hypothetical protein